RVVLFEVVDAATELLRADRGLLERGVVHHHVILTVLVEELSLGALDADAAELLLRTERLIGDRAGGHVAQLGADDGGPATLLHVREVDDLEEVAVALTVAPGRRSEAVIMECSQWLTGPRAA